MNQQQLPGASTALTMGIIGVIAPFVCCGPFALIFGIIGLNSAKSAQKLYDENPNLYTGIENAKTGKTLSYICIGISIVLLLFTILYFGAIIAFFTTDGFGVGLD
ncbi:CCC motif membrane protein [Euzebyella saccharophila]|uniref:CCC motif membrane protein n=1 Tax=Euzebyella saccharophila TaxID=679664 RepID=A0ABV8JTQ1_9FLAO|nr:CCC motif membrane protein [Euzebyella saccharophila]